jgi:DNA polymerase (family 10)
MQRSEALRYLRRMAQTARLLGEPPARARVFGRAARTLRSWTAEDWARWTAGEAAPSDALDPRIEPRLRRFVATGRARDLEARLLRIPPGLFDILRVRGLNPARARALWQEGRIVTLRQLARACRRGALARLPGFDEGLQTRILARFVRARHLRTTWLRHRALAAAGRREAELERIPGVLRVARAGEMRRATELVSRLVWVVAAEAPATVLARLATLEGARLLPVASPDRVRREPPDEPPEEIVVVDAAHLAARLFLETGARAHVRGVLRRLARRDTGLPPPGWEPAPASPDEAETGGLRLPADEAEIYARAALAFVPPELREGRGEVRAARAGTLPRLVEPGELQGVFHVHTNWSDGRAALPEIAAEARALGWRYVGIADHSRGAFYARGLDAARLAQQADEVRRVQRDFPDVRIFHGVECDILPDGRLDLDARALGALDYVIVSIHTLLDMEGASMTRRVVEAIRHPAATILAHPSGRLFHERPPYRLEWSRVFEAAAASGVAIEFNTTPSRLDLDWRRIRAATGRGVRLAVNPDAHHLEGLHRVALGLETARKGWLTAEQVLNTRSVVEMEEHFHARRSPR